ncbi:uncharacterized protein LOC141614784 [Silene latifolia]|uniref:uncharacterized protein LOC141614784 n=1 Tax=Silene latifolia TaxID=37657 RepID=UPI003D76B8CC
MSDLAEVFSVRVFSKHGPVSSDELYGSIVVNDHRGETVFFKRTGGPSDDSILPDGSISLTPDRCTKGGHWSIRLKLYHKKGQNDLEICKGFFAISHAEYCSLYRRPMIGILHGRDGHALVNLVMFTSAVQATVEVSLIADVGCALYGHICAGNDFVKSRNPGEKYFQITMFSVSKDKACYTNGSHIPLSRCMTPVPLKRKLRIETELFDPITNMTVAVGTASFVARPNGSQTETIGCIQIKVTWTEASNP